jgi:hypothetical protein
MASTVSDNQGSHKGSIRRGLFGRRTTQVTAPPKRVNGDAFFGVEGVATTREQPRIHGDRPGEASAPIHRTPPTDPDPVLKNILAIASKALVERWSSTKSDDELAPHFDQLRLRSGRELESAQTIGRRLERGLDETVRMAKAIELADALGALDAVDPVAAGAAMARRAVHASDPLAETGLIPVVRESGALAAPAPSPVHEGDGTTPPLPEPEQAPAGPATLPKRHPQPVASFPAEMCQDDPESPVHGGPVPAIDLLKDSEGVWFLDEDGTWREIAAVTANDEDGTVVIRPVHGLKVAPRFDRQMWVLSASAAKSLLADYETRPGGAA